MQLWSIIPTNRSSKKGLVYLECGSLWGEVAAAAESLASPSEESTAIRRVGGAQMQSKIPT